MNNIESGKKMQNGQAWRLYFKDSLFSIHYLVATNGDKSKKNKDEFKEYKYSI